MLLLNHPFQTRKDIKFEEFKCFLIMLSLYVIIHNLVIKVTSFFAKEKIISPQQKVIDKLRHI